MAKVVLMVDPATVELDPEPMPAKWILSGAPVTRGKKLLTSHDWTSTVVVWDCSPGSFHWHFSKDETIYVLSGECFMTNAKGEERRFAAGDLAFFYAGFSCDFRVTQHFRKVAVLRETMWFPFGIGLKAWNKFLGLLGFAGKSPLMFLLAVTALASHLLR
jgi:uncharacterized cupin superfamily protein